MIDRIDKSREGCDFDLSYVAEKGKGRKKEEEKEGGRGGRGIGAHLVCTSLSRPAESIVVRLR